jgi:hypothetical protein
MGKITPGQAHFMQSVVELREADLPAVAAEAIHAYHRIRPPMAKGKVIQPGHQSEDADMFHVIIPELIRRASGGSFPGRCPLCMESVEALWWPVPDEPRLTPQEDALVGRAAREGKVVVLTPPDWDATKRTVGRNLLSRDSDDVHVVRPR